jgi:hypothetical protein
MMGDTMKFRRKMALLTATAFVLQGLLGALPPPAAAEDDLAAFTYLKIPFGYDGGSETEPVYGFAVAQTDNGWLMAPSFYGAEQMQLPALVDLRFGGDDDPLPSLSFSGVDIGLVVDQALHQNAPPGPAPGLGEWILIGAGVALAGITGCAAAGCFDDDDDAVAAEGGGEGV